MLTDGDRVTVTTRPVDGHAALIPCQYAGLAGDVRPGSRVLLADGSLELRAERVDGTEIACVVLHGGPLRDHQGINLPGTPVSAPALTDKDRDDARFAVSLGVDYLALSFVRDATDISELRELVAGAGDDAPWLIAKIERPEALDHIHAIVEASDAIMIARGDLGVELPPEDVPVAQRQLVVQARARHKPTIVATQMLESMIEHPQPTRAEVSDVSTAVYGGADAVMLSAETASGRYPLRAVEMMNRIARRVESAEWAEHRFGVPAAAAADDHDQPVADAFAEAVALLSRDLGVRAIVVVTGNGATAQVLSSARPAAPLLALCASAGLAQRLALSWGVIPIVDAGAEADAASAARAAAMAHGLCQAGDHLLLVSGFGSRLEPEAPSLAVLRA
jgi:pyruvate kinase